MTQPVSPFGPPQTGGNVFGTPQFDPDKVPDFVPAQQPMPGAPPPQTMADQAAAHFQQKDQKEQDEAAQLEALKNEYGAGEVVAGKFVQGALDAFLAPGALEGAAAESAGELFRNQTLRDFGRGLGEASSGKSAMAAFGGLAQAGIEGSALAGARFMDTAQERLEKSDEARPLLATISRMAGLSAGAMALGAGAGEESGHLATIAGNAMEGASGGAQAAYEHGAPLRDVLSATAVGSILGGSIAAAGEAFQVGLKRAPDLGKVFGDYGQNFADSSALKAVVDRDPKAIRWFLDLPPERQARVAERIRGAEILGKGDKGMLEGLTVETDKAVAARAAIAKQMDEGHLTPQIGDLMGNWDNQVATLRASGTGDDQGIADALERMVSPFKKNLEIPGELGVPPQYRNPTFTELNTFRQRLGAAKASAFQRQDVASQEISKLYGHTAEALNNAADWLGPSASRLWKESGEEASDLIHLKDGLENQIQARLRRRFVSPSDYATSIGAGLATMVMSANPVAGAVAAIGMGIGNHVLRVGGRALFSKLANNFAKIPSHVPLLKAGGPEAQEILSAILKTKNFMEDTAVRTGVNPTLQQGAREAAKQVAGEQLAKQAGEFVPATWAAKPLNPLQKVFARTQILDAVSKDVAKAAEETAALHPELPEALDVQRLSKLTKDADGTKAIGSLQQMVASSVDAAPLTPMGSAGGVILRRLSKSLETADPANAMAKTHEAANWFREVQQSTEDQTSREFAQRTEAALRSEIGSVQWGQAGIEYAKLTAPPHPALEELADPAKLREILRTGEVEKELGHTINAAQDHVAAAYDARYKLTGAARPEDLVKKMRLHRKVFDAAEEAVTIDGKPFARLFDAANASGVYQGTDAHLDKTNERTVSDHVGAGLDQIEPLLTGENMRKTATVAGSVSAAKEDEREQYDARLKKLTHAVSQPAATAAHPMYAANAPDVGGKLAQLLADMPKPSSSIHGKAMETLSRDDLRLANAMWEATTEPMTVFSDLAHGTLDPDKAAYAWKQYPGLQQAAQAGVIDLMMGLPDDKRSSVPDHVVTQLDSALGFNGKLQDANEPAFSDRMSKLYQPAPPKPPPGGMLKSPAANPTFTERLSGAQQ